MKRIFLIGLMIMAVSCNGQIEKQNKLTVANFDVEILNYSPIKNELNKNSYADGIKKLDETKDRIRKRKNIDISDYWNILTIFSELKESNENLNIAFEKVANAQGKCEYIESMEDYFGRYAKYLQPKLAKQLKICKNIDQTKETFNIAEYSKKNGLDKSLVKSINQIGILDQKDRYKETIQNKLDIQNQKKIDSLYKKYQTYIGKTLVGNELKSVMWQVIHHSNLKYMEKYFPAIVSAVKNNELEENALKYSIDRISAEKYNYQIFGSQGNIKMADEKTRTEIKSKYGIE